MIIRKYPIDGLKGQEQIAYGNAVGLGNIRCRPERATAQSLFLLLPFQGDWSVSHLPKALLRDVAHSENKESGLSLFSLCATLPWATISLPRWGVSANCG